jgi:hypothetical protein
MLLLFIDIWHKVFRCVRRVEFLRVLGEKELSWFLFVKSWGDAGLHVGSITIQSHRPIP